MSILVRHAMSGDPQTLSPDLTAADAAGLMTKLDVGVVPVVEDGNLLGLVTDRDLVTRVIAQRTPAEEVRLRDVLTSSPVTVTPDMKLSEARDIMAEHQIRRLPVVKADELVGILSLGDVALADRSERAVGDTLRATSESEATETLAGDPPRGTPERVARH
ncbi:MAG: CBS domain-containing protein [Actinomycetota bacterium]